MDFDLTVEQQQLSDGLSRFLDSRYDLTESRTAAKLGDGTQPAIWRAFADDLGVIGACLPSVVGGDDGGPEELMVITEALGYALVVEPFVDTVVMGAQLLARTGHAGARSIAERVVAGDTVLATAALEAESGGRLHHVATTAEPDGDSWILRGAKTVVTSAPIADHLIVTARIGGDLDDRDGIGLFVVEVAGSDGMSMHAFRTVDDRRAADIAFDGTRVRADALVASGTHALDLLEHAWDTATAAVVSEAVGVMRRVLADTVAYTGQRQQFGRPLAGFQVLAHRMVDMYIELEQAVAAQYLAILSLDAEPIERAAAVSAAKATIGRAARFMGQNAVQLHGGMGMTEELAIGHYFRRLTVIEYEFGSTDAHLARFEHLSRS